MLQGGHAGFPPQQVAQVVGRKTELVGTVLYSRKAFGSRSVGMEVVVQQGFKTGKYVAIQVLAGDELAVVETDTVIKQELDIIHDERLAVFVKDRTLQLLADVLHAADEDLPLRRGKPEAGLHGNTHFPMSDLNNMEVAELMAKWLHEKGLD